MATSPPQTLRRRIFSGIDRFSISNTRISLLQSNDELRTIEGSSAESGQTGGSDSTRQSDDLDESTACKETSFGQTSPDGCMSVETMIRAAASLDLSNVATPRDDNSARDLSSSDQCLNHRVNTAARGATFADVSTYHLTRASSSHELHLPSSISIASAVAGSCSSRRAFSVKSKGTLASRIGLRLRNLRVRKWLSKRVYRVRTAHRTRRARRTKLRKKRMQSLAVPKSRDDTKVAEPEIQHDQPVISGGIIEIRHQQLLLQGAETSSFRIKAVSWARGHRDTLRVMACILLEIGNGKPWLV
jgi:hypothetical protein